MVDADSAWIFVGESIVNKVYIHEDTERNFLHQENYMVTDVTGKSITFVFYLLAVLFVMEAVLAKYIFTRLS